ncbi:UNVERIFIED_CONTAM: hypothetical protein HDU68_006308 [Siphonaria sp. JEL0065]|nr:hypothetical protein HDU68_006308 [Siphonaria sp. JEL0065]
MGGEGTIFSHKQNRVVQTGNTLRWSSDPYETPNYILPSGMRKKEAVAKITRATKAKSFLESDKNFDSMVKQESTALQTLGFPDGTTWSDLSHAQQTKLKNSVEGSEKRSLVDEILDRQKRFREHQTILAELGFGSDRTWSKLTAAEHKEIRELAESDWAFIPLSSEFGGGANIYESEESAEKKNPDHLKEFSHPIAALSTATKTKPVTVPTVSVKAASTSVPLLPSEEDDQSNDYDATKSSATSTPSVLDSSSSSGDITNINGITPNVLLKDGEKLDHDKYTIKRTHDHYYCTCPAWRMNKFPIDARSCKHLAAVLGESYEKTRLKFKNPQGLLRSGLQATAPAPAKKPKRKATDSEGEESDASTSGKSAKKATASKKKKKDTSDADDDELDAAEKFTTKNRAKRDEIKLKQPALLLAQKYEPGSVDPTGWWISEKLDGVRAFWDHEREEFVSRLGNPFTAPDWFKDAMPKDLSLDGELFGGRGKFSETISVVKTINSPHWKKVEYQVFDSPTMTTLPFEKRIEKLKALYPSTDPLSSASASSSSSTTTTSTTTHVKIVNHEKCRNAAHILSALKEVESKGGEGLMLREPKSLYVGKRSTSLLKVKSFYDAEAIVIGHEPGKGRNANVTGSLKCRMASGKEFKIGTGLSDKERQDPPKIGDIVTYRFQELTNDGIPRFPSFVCVRIDADKPVDAVIREVKK